MIVLESKGLISVLADFGYPFTKKFLGEEQEYIELFMLAHGIKVSYHSVYLNLWELKFNDPRKEFWFNIVYGELIVKQVHL